VATDGRVLHSVRNTRMVMKMKWIKWEGAAVVPSTIYLGEVGKTSVGKFGAPSIFENGAACMVFQILFV